MVWIKICGITTIDDALTCSSAGADAIGLVFAPGRRQVSAEKAAAIAAVLPRDIKKVGVFVDAPPGEVARLEREVGLDLLQFHGSESPVYCSRFQGKAIKAFPVAEDFKPEVIGAYRGIILACLLDTFIPGLPGGTGKTWNRELFKPERFRDLVGIPFIVAGGITAGNVTAVINDLHPDGVDTSSGVEIDGCKDHRLIKEFVKKIRRSQYGEPAR